MSPFLRLFSSVILFAIIDCKPDYCLPNEDCWPTTSEISTFGRNLNGELLTQGDSEYVSYVNMTQNLLYRDQYPSFFAICNDVSDIQKSILFASSHNIQISILSTGHSWSGVSTANYSLQINLSKMKNHKLNDIDPTHMSITVETGLQWGDIYKIADQNGHRIAIGGADSSVGPGGYSLGGGHSPISPAFGLSSDWITEYYMVDSNANIIHIHNTSSDNQTIDDIFWALRGGGGGTFGVIVNITFTLHNPTPNSVFTLLQCTYSFYEFPVVRQNNVLGLMLNNFFELISSTNGLDPKWSGYLMVPLSEIEQDVLQINLIYYGNQTYAMANSEPLLSLNAPYNNSENNACEYTVFQTFYEFVQMIPPFTNGIAYAQVFNDLIPSQNLTNELTQTMVDFFNSSHVTDGFIRAMTSVLIGGAVNQRSDDFSSVNPAWRHSVMELGLSFYWSDSDSTQTVIEHSNEWQSKFWKFGYSQYGATYSNEQDYECDDCDWKQMFFGDHYDKLLQIKHKWDPDQVFWCHYCVGDES